MTIHLLFNCRIIKRLWFHMPFPRPVPVSSWQVCCSQNLSSAAIVVQLWSFRSLLFTFFVSGLQISCLISCYLDATFFEFTTTSSFRWITVATHQRPHEPSNMYKIPPSKLKSQPNLQLISHKKVIITTRKTAYYVHTTDNKKEIQHIHKNSTKISTKNLGQHISGILFRFWRNREPCWKNKVWRIESIPMSSIY